MKELELLAPARNADIGIAAIGCGADAVYMAGPEFGARQAAGNSMEDVRRVCEHAHRFGARVFMTLNTILFDDEIERARKMLQEAKDAGVDAIIAQDPAVWKMTDLPVHASTQCAIRTTEKALFYESLGSARVVLERELSLEQIKAVRDNCQCEIEFFVHGALCVCYSGQCYMSESISGRSANRGECIQACRSLYDLEDENGNVLVRNKALLSLRDYNLLERLEDLAEAGVDSFKIEGRLKNIFYVRNVVKAYSQALDALVEKHPETYRRASFGRTEGGFTPDLDKTFNRGYTELFIDAKKDRWSSMDAPKSMGEEIGSILKIDAAGRGQDSILVRFKDEATKLSNGDGFSFIARGRSEIIGFRGDVCSANRIVCKEVPELYVGARLFRNLDSAFEKELENNLPTRRIPVGVHLSITGQEGAYSLEISAISQDGRKAGLTMDVASEKAGNPQRMESMFSSQIAKATGDYSFALDSLSVGTQDGSIPFMSASALNGIRRELAVKLDEMGCISIPLALAPTVDKVAAPEMLDYKANCSNSISRETYLSLGAKTVEDAYELTHRKDAELMRTKYCIRFELGMCPVHQKAEGSGPLFLLNNGKRYALKFDCRNCEMSVIQK